MSLATGLLTKTAVGQLSDNFIALVQGALTAEELEFSVDSSNQLLHVTGAKTLPNGEAGRFVGTYNVPYEKASIAELLPWTILYDGPYPVTYGQFRQTLESKYGIVFEEQDFAELGSTTPLLDTHYLSQTPDVTTGCIELTTTSLSKRFVAHQSIFIQLGSYNTLKRASEAYRQFWTPSLSSISNQINLLTATEEDAIKELMYSTVGELPSFDVFQTAIKTTDNDVGRFVCLPKDASQGTWSTGFEFRFYKFDLDELVVDSLSYSGTYPIPFDTLRSSLRSTYGFDLQENTWGVGSYTAPALKAGDSITPTLDANGIFELYSKRSSAIWKGRKRLRIRCGVSAGSTLAPYITNAAKSQTSPGAWEHQYVTNYVVGTPTYSIVAGQPPGPIDSTSGKIVGNGIAGVYLWTVRVDDSGRPGFYGLRTDQVKIL